MSKDSTFFQIAAEAVVIAAGAVLYYILVWTVKKIVKIFKTKRTPRVVEVKP